MSRFNLVVGLTFGFIGGGYSAVVHSAESLKETNLEEIVVTSHLLSEGGAAQSLSVLSGEELLEKSAASLGETVSREPGINSASFGAAVGRPVIHGLAGARVKTTEDRIDSLDLATASADHAVTVEPFIADQITILKGPSTLLYGSAAIGGVVDVETGRIAKELPEQDFMGRVELRAADNANAKTGALRLDGRIGESFAWHVDAFSKQADDYDIPGMAESAAQRAREEAEEHEGEEHSDEEHGEEEHGEEEGEFGTLESSFFDSEGGAIGFSFIGERGFVGASISKIDSNYGIVGGHHEHEDEEGHEDEHDDEHEGEEEHEHEGEEEEIVFIDLEQTRYDIEAQLNDVSSLIESINFRLGLNDYTHQEIEGDELGTLFENDAWEGRLEFRHASVAGFKGTAGIQLSERDYSAIGEEAFVAPVDSQTQGFFWVGERNFEGFDLEAGVRIESVEHDSSIAGIDALDFSAQSLSIGAVVPISSELTLSAIFDHSKRAPTIEELFSNGPHLATQSFEIGNLALNEETANALSFAATYQSDLLDINATLYHMEFDDFIYQSTDGSERDELPVFFYQQDGASFTGLDFEAVIHLAKVLDGDADLSLLYDIVDAELDIAGNRNLPRIPASRYGLGLKWQNENWSAKFDWLHVTAQDDIADFELATDAYDDVSLRINRRIDLGSAELNVFVQGRNLTDDEQRHHASFVKDLAPAPGRRIEAGVRLRF